MIWSLVQPSGTPAASHMDAVVPPHILLIKMGPQDDPKACLNIPHKHVCGQPCSGRSTSCQGNHCLQSNSSQLPTCISGSRRPHPASPHPVPPHLLPFPCPSPEPPCPPPFLCHRKVTNSPNASSPNLCPLLFFLTLLCLHANAFPNSFSLSPQMEASVLTRTGTNPRQVCRCSGKGAHFQDQRLLKETGILIHIPVVSWASTDQAGTYCVAVSIQGCIHQALVDSGCNQTTVHQNLIQCVALGNV